MQDMNAAAEKNVAMIWSKDTDRTLVLACSDPRFRQATEWFVENELHLKRFTPLFLPGGPATILLSSSIFFAVRPLVELLNGKFHFLRVIGVNHEDCAYYHHKYSKMHEDELHKKQLADLAEFKTEVHRLVDKEASIELYIEKHNEQHIYFEPIA